MSDAREILRIHNFGGLTDAEIEISRLNIFIGPQGTGKSVAAKLLYYFRQILRNMATDSVGHYEVSTPPHSHPKVFREFFPTESWPSSDFRVDYEYGELSIGVASVPGKRLDIAFSYSEYYYALAAVGREATKKALDSSDPLPSLAARNAINQKIATEIDSRLGRLNYFVPEARGYVSAEDLLNLVNSDHRVDPFLREFVSIYGPLPGRAEGILSFYARNTRIADVLQGEIESRSSEMFVKAIDGRRVPVDCASSGQRAALPLMLTLLEHSQGSHFDEVGSLFIEEPEAHLYPTGQREITRIIADLGGLDRDARPQYIITTHSPYLLTAFNNLIYAGKIVRAKPERKSAVDSVLGDVPVIDPSNVRAYAFESGRVRSIVDPETELILAAELDNVSDDLGGEFDKLMDVDYAEYAA